MITHRMKADAEDVFVDMDGELNLTGRNVPEMEEAVAADGDGVWLPHGRRNAANGAFVARLQQRLHCRWIATLHNVHNFIHFHWYPVVEKSPFQKFKVFLFVFQGLFYDFLYLN